MNEKQLEKKLREKIKSLGGLCLKLPTIHISGLPDRLCLLPGGTVFFVELKGPGKKPRKIQLKIHNKLKALGFTVYTVDSEDLLCMVVAAYT